MKIDVNRLELAMRYQGMTHAAAMLWTLLAIHTGSCYSATVAWTVKSSTLQLRHLSHPESTIKQM